MQYLPPLAAGEAVCRLPLWEETAAGLIVALLEDDAAARRDRLCGLLTGDPALTIWIALHPRRPRVEPRDLEELAVWLAEQAPTVFDGSTDSPALCVHDDSHDALAWRRRAATAISLAHVAAHAVSTPQVATRIRLVAHLHNAVEWLLAGATPRCLESLEPLIPPWLRRWLVELQQPSPRADAAVRAVAEALLVVRERETSPLTTTLPSAPSCAAMLPHLAAKLSRLQKLEADLQSVLRDEKLASLQKLAYGASHEINNPLANIATRAQTLLHDETDPERRRALATINDQAFRAFEMIANMMLFAKPPELNLADVDLRKLVAQIIDEMAPAAQQQGTALRGGGDEAVILADAVQLAVLLRALCRNALQAVESGGEVEVNVRRSDEAAKLFVRDTGPGLSDEARRHLFDPFYSSREAGRGLGFGLSWCWTIVQAHRGKIAFESETGKGTAFTVTLPVDAGGSESDSRL